MVTARAFKEAGAAVIREAKRVRATAYNHLAERVSQVPSSILGITSLGAITP